MRKTILILIAVVLAGTAAGQQGRVQCRPDTFKVCADNVLAYAYMLTASNMTPVMDSSLLGMLVQTLLTPEREYVDNKKLTAAQVDNLLLPFPAGTNH